MSQHPTEPSSPPGGGGAAPQLSLDSSRGALGLSIPETVSARTKSQLLRRLLGGQRFLEACGFPGSR